MTVYRQGSPILNEDATQVVGYLRRSIKVQGKILTFPLEDDHRTAMSFSNPPTQRPTPWGHPEGCTATGAVHDHS